MTVARDPASFRDPRGFVFRRDGSLFRQFDRAYAPHFEALIESSLYDDLVGDGLLVAHEEVDLAFAATSSAYKVIRPRLVAFISYPYEWCFGQLRDAALLTLEIERRSLERGLTLKDASAFNIQFSGGRAVLIDTLSFEVWEEGSPWIAYRQFCQHFLAPLLLMSRIEDRMVDLLRSHLDGVPLDLASRLLPRRSWLRPASLIHVHAHARLIAKHAATRPSDHRLHGRMTKTARLGLVASLTGAIDRLRPSPRASEWSHYEGESSYAGGAFHQKRQLVREAVRQLRPETVWDLGSNTGGFSRIATEEGARVVSIDGDFGAVEENYRVTRANGEGNLLPLRIDLTNPTPRLGWAGRERMSLADRGPADLVLALALIHHLALTNNTPLASIAGWFAEIARHLVVEFVPKDDPQARRLLLSRRDVFDHYTEADFREAFERHFATRRRLPLEGTDRVLYLMERR